MEVVCGEKTKGMDMEWIIIEIIHLLMRTVMKYGIQVAHQIMLIVIPMQVMAHSLRLKIEQLDILLNLIILRLHLIIIHMGIYYCTHMGMTTINRPQTTIFLNLFQVKWLVRITTVILLVQTYIQQLVTAMISCTEC